MVKSKYDNIVNLSYCLAIQKLYSFPVLCFGGTADGVGPGLLSTSES